MALDPAYPAPGSKLTTMGQWESLFARTTVDGVVSGVGWEFAPSLDSAARMAVVNTGAAVIRGFYVAGSTPTPTPVPAADTQPRIDRLVLRLDRTATKPADWIRPVVVTGTPAPRPQPPALARTPDGAWDLPICRWTSAADGALTDLADERSFNSGSVLAMHSFERPSPDRPVVAYERDTGRWMSWNTKTWRALADDTGWVPFQPGGYWKPGTYPLKARKIDNIVYLKGSVLRTTATLPVDDTDSPVATIFAAFRPPEDHWWMGIVSGLSYAALQLTPQGVIKIRQHSAPIPIGRQVWVDTTFMVGENP